MSVEQISSRSDPSGTDSTFEKNYFLRTDYAIRIQQQ